MYDVIIVWAWSAWYPAWMYAWRYKLKNLIIWAQPWWALATSHRVENYPWIISAPWKEIMDNFKKHAKTFWSEILHESVEEIEKKDTHFSVTTNSQKKFEAKRIILATWNNYRKLGAKGEKEFLWRGVSYCATCDWMFFKEKDIVIVWGWNTAVTEALYLSEIASKVSLVHRRDSFRAEDYRIWKIKEKENIELVLSEEVEEIYWDFLGMKWVQLKSWKKLEADWIFVAIWTVPNTKIVEKFWLEKDEEWCLFVDKRQETSFKWLYAAWDVTTNSNKFKQTIMSAAEWCLAADSIHEDLM